MESYLFNGEPFAATSETNLLEQLEGLVYDAVGFWPEGLSADVLKYGDCIISGPYDQLRLVYDSDEREFYLEKIEEEQPRDTWECPKYGLAWGEDF